MRTRNKVVVGVGIVGVLAVAAVLGSNGTRANGVEVRVEAVQKRDLVATVTASGNVRARRKVDISSDVSARVTELLIEEGQDVSEGQILLRLDPTRFQAILNRNQATLLQSRAQVAQAQANFARAQREARRLAELRDRDSLLVSRQDLENALTDEEVQRSLLESSEYGVRQAQAAVEEAEEELAKTIIRAPISGRVTRLNVEEGETVIVGTMNNPGSLVLTVSDLSVMEVVLEVDETDMPEISLGDSATVDLDAFPNRKFHGIVSEIGNSAIRSPSAAAGTGATPTIDFEVVVTLQEDSAVALRPDLSATADLITATRTDQISIPIIALTVRELDPDSAEAAGFVFDEAAAGDDDDSAAGKVEVEGVYVVADGRVAFRPVKVGIAGQEYFEVVSGVAEGDVVASGPYQAVRTLSDGDHVQTAEESANEEEEGSSTQDT